MRKDILVDDGPEEIRAADGGGGIYKDQTKDDGKLTGMTAQVGP